MVKVLVAAVPLLVAVCSTAGAALVQLEGDLGNQTSTGAVQPLAVGNTLVEAFSFNAATGTLTGEVHAANQGAVLDLRITNLVYQATADGAAPGAHSIELYVGQEYAAAPGPYTANHVLNGTADLDVGQSAFALLLGTHNFSTLLPSVSDTVTGPGTGLPLSDGPAGQVVNLGSNIYVIEARLILSFDGGFAAPTTITLPASAHITATLVPEQAASGWMLLAGLLPAIVALAYRRRSRNR